MPSGPAKPLHAMGVAVFSGMIGVTAFGIVFTPMFYVLLRALAGNRPLTQHGAAPMEHIGASRIDCGPLTFYRGKIESASVRIVERKAVPIADTTARILLFLQSTRHFSEAAPSFLD
jgi:hypothetical protein